MNDSKVTIRAATQNAAEFLGAQQEFGTVVVDKRADLLLVRENPFQNIDHLQEIEGIVLRGRWFSRPELDRMLKKRQSSLAK